jgi:hypothetical protein
MPRTKETGIVTVAAIRRPKGKRVTQYLFNEKQAIFTLRATREVSQGFLQSSARFSPEETSGQSPARHAASPDRRIARAIMPAPPLRPTRLIYRKTPRSRRIVIW